MNIAQDPTAGSLPSLKIRNPWSWYAVAASRDLPAGKIMQVVLNGENLVLWRSEQGRACVWGDRCPHRGMRLSLGASYGESLVCPYHGWNFGTDGHCHRIPAHPQLSPSRAARTRIYPIVEQHDYVWVCLGEPSSSQPQTITDMIPVRTLHLTVDVDVAIAALVACPLDPAASSPGPFPCAGEDDPEWTRDGSDVVVVTTAVASERDRHFTAQITLPGEVTCKFASSGGQQVSYRALIQPTDIGACAIHFAIEPPAATEAKLAFNRALVALRHNIGRLASAPAVARTIETFARMAQDHGPA